MINSSSALQTYIGAVGQQLQLWIENFTGSFKDGKLKTTLSKEVWFSRQPARVWHGDREIAGLAVGLLPENRQVCKYLSSKLRTTLRYRIRQIDPKVKILSLSDPIGERAVNVVVESGEVMLTFLPRGEWR